VHFDPAVSLAFTLHGRLPWHDVPGYGVTQIVGGILVVWATHLMFDLPMWQWSIPLSRTGGAQLMSEIIATFGLLLAFIVA
jgi:glycerol uptake facilitator-like aquaporin